MKGQSRNLTISQAATLKPGDNVVYFPETSGYPFPNPELFTDLKPGELYVVEGVRYFGVCGGSSVIQELSEADLEGRIITDGYAQPLTNVTLGLKDVPGIRFYGYFTPE